MNRYEVPKALDYSTRLLDGRAVRNTALGTFVGGLHEALIGAEVIGYVELSFEDGSIHPAIVVRRRRPFIPFGTDPKLVNKECSRLFAIIPREKSGPWIDGERFDVVDVTPP